MFAAKIIFGQMITFAACAWYSYFNPILVCSAARKVELGSCAAGTRVAFPTGQPARRRASRGRGTTSPAVSAAIQAFFFKISGGLVLGCIEAELWKPICVLQHFQAPQDVHTLSLLRSSKFIKQLASTISDFSEISASFCKLCKKLQNIGKLQISDI